MARVRFDEDIHAPTKLDIARQWLREHMAAGEAYSAGTLQQQAASDGIKTRTLQLAASYEAEITPQYGGRGIRAWQWKLK